MVLYEVNVSGLRSALNCREISHLYRAGQLHSKTRCRVKGQAEWSSIGELFPLMAPIPRIYELPDELSPALRRFRRGVSVMALLALITIGAFFFRGKLSRDSAATTPATASLPRVSDTMSLASEKTER
jgi:hypothetical protein